jgi:hypothetical protein
MDAEFMLGGLPMDPVCWVFAVSDEDSTVMEKCSSHSSRFEHSVLVANVSEAF